MILRDCNRTVDPCCDNVVGLVFGDLWPASFASSVSFTDSENNKQGTPWKLELRIVAWRKPRMFSEENVKD